MLDYMMKFETPHLKTLLREEENLLQELQTMRDEIAQLEEHTEACTIACEELTSEIDQLQLPAKEQIENMPSLGVKKILNNMTYEVQKTANRQLCEIEDVKSHAKTKLKTLQASFADEQSRAYFLRDAIVKMQLSGIGEENL